jgi:peroxiredoxin family protein
MKKSLFILAVLMSLTTLNIHAQCGGGGVHPGNPTSIGIVIYSNDIETVWNALRFANFAKNQGDTVNIFLLGKGVELENLAKSDTAIQNQTNLFLDGGTILGCGTCLKSRKNNAPQVCKFSSMGDLYALVRKNKIILTF